MPWESWKNRPANGLGILQSPAMVLGNAHTHIVVVAGGWWVMYRTASSPGLAVDRIQASDRSLVSFTRFYYLLASLSSVAVAFSVTNQ